ncbi:MAG TPA: lipocalin-like domain-containing protein [Steroidobacteraceae bacterium]|nr:lipocalin-like domain-containing protein [Steroidobacteraceae bacterium]
MRPIGWLSAAAIGLCGLLCAQQPEQPPALAPVTAGARLEFPRDLGSHDAFGIEWWYITGWLTAPDNEPLGFQITFFRTRVVGAGANPSAFATDQILIAHCALSDAKRGRLWQDQRVRRAGMGLAQAQSGQTRVWVDDWRLERSNNIYHTSIAADEFALDLTLAVTQPPMLNGQDGYSQKGPAEASASYYYSEPQLHVAGSVTRSGQRSAVSGLAWLDHEWSSQPLDPAAVGWDWTGLNLDDGGALMAFRIRDQEGHTYWSAGSERDAAGHTQRLTADQLDFKPLRQWRSPRTGVSYPVSWRLQAGERTLELAPLMDDQENDTRLSTGAIYWEGAVRASERGQPVGRGYLELTGYEKPLTLR